MDRETSAINWARELSSDEVRAIAVPHDEDVW